MGWNLNNFGETVGDRLVALIFLILFFPVLLGVYSLLRMSSNRPLIVEDQTVIRGKVVRTYRFRTTGPGTPSFHHIGQFLRRWRIDEWPSIWNVVRGDVRIMDLAMWDSRQ